MLVKKKTIETEVDMTPMIDVVFQLIIFFMVAISMAVVYGVVIKFPLGKANNKDKSKADKKPPVISVFIEQDYVGAGHKVARDGNLKIIGETVPMWVSGDPATMEKDREEAFKYVDQQIAFQLRKEDSKWDKEKFVIKAHPRTYQWKIVKILDIAQKHGLSKFSLSPPAVKQ